MNHRHRAARLVLLSVICCMGLSALAGAAARADSLPQGLCDWMSCEQGRMSRSVDHSRLVALTNHQDPRYAPETGATFTIKTYWVDADKMHTFSGRGMPKELRGQLMRTRDGTKQVRLIVHPESENLYRDLLQGARRGQDLQARATASSRSLLVWPQGKPERAFFAKVSLDKEIGGVRRTISQGEVARSVGVNNVLSMAGRRKELPGSFGYIPEVFSAIPRGMSEGGMVIRAIPKEVMQGQVRYVPLFSLYAEPKGGGRPLLADMIQRSGQSPESFVRERIVRPFVQQWIQLSMKQGIIPEPHAQNVLLEVGRDGLPTGRFIHRDFGGFHLDFEHRQNKRLAMPRQMPRISSLEQDYKIGRYGSATDMVGRNLDAFFYGGFIYNLDAHLPTWGSKGWLGGARIKSGTFKSMLTGELEQAYSRMTGQRLDLHGDLRLTSRMVGPVRSLITETSSGSKAGTGRSTRYRAKTRAKTRAATIPGANSLARTKIRARALQTPRRPVVRFLSRLTGRLLGHTPRRGARVR